MNIRKRGTEVGFSPNGSLKRSRQETESSSIGVGIKSKPCTKYFSTAGCPFGEDCHFLHRFPGGYNAVAQMNLASPAPSPLSSRKTTAQPFISNGTSTATIKSRLCKNYNTAEGCKFGTMCHFAHGELDLGNPVPHDGRTEPPQSDPAASFGASSTAKISIDASVVGALIGKGGVHSKQIVRQTGAKFSICDDETNPTKKNIMLVGSFAQVQQAGMMVSELIMNLPPQVVHAKGGAGGGPPTAAHRGSSNFKTKLCENFGKGSCTFGERCHFAHGDAELRKAVI